MCNAGSGGYEADYKRDGYARHNREYNVFLREPFFVDSLNRAVFEENRSIRTDSETFFYSYICNVNYLAWPDPIPTDSEFQRKGTDDEVPLT